MVMRPLILSFLAFVTLAATQGKQTFTGTITDDVCGKDGHSRMRMGPTDAECAVACISEHGAMYVLYDDKNVYTLSDQQTPEKFAAQKVKIIGTLNTKTRTILVDSIAMVK
jgi:translation elongation factor P/translation initiation factor 5A